MTTRFVLLHSPLMGPLAWQAVAAELRRRGQTADAPAWTLLGAVEGAYYDALAEGMAETLCRIEEPLWLVAHSGAGGLVDHLEAHLANVAGVILVDAILPHPGKSWFETAPPDLAQQLRAGAQAGDLPPWDQWWPPGALERLVPDAAPREALVGELASLPLAWFEEAAPASTYRGPTAYLQLSGAYDAESQAAARYGWPLVRLPLHHLAMLTHPEAVAGALVSLAERLAEPAHG
jgi:hypothetical protein